MTLSRIVVDSAEADADHAALVDGDRTWTAAELADAVGRTSRRLLDLGVAPGDRVGVHLNKSAEGFIAMHGVIAAGAVAVPLDPSSPAERLSAIARTVGISVIVSHAPRRRSIIEIAERHRLHAVVGLDEPLDAVRTVTSDQIDEASPSLPVSVGTDDPAYIITTSGSTGEPKGIVHTHGSARAYVDASVAAFGVSSADRVTDIAPHHFDISTFAVWAAPSAGATVVVVPEPHQKFPASLSALVQDERMTIWYSVPFLLQQLVLRGDLEHRDLSQLRLVKFGGEVPAHSILAGLVEHAPEAQLVNVYGPAEVNQCTHYVVTPGDLEAGTIPIGHPWPAAEVRVTHPDSDSPDTDVDEGELWVASATMMAGYFGEPDLDTSPIVEVDARRWYRTGDLVERRPDGSLVFRGRRDQQVKVRGHRIEIEAIESQLERVSGIEAAVVTVMRRPDGSDELIAGIVPVAPAGSSGTEPPDVAFVTAAVRPHLPAYAIPSHVVTISGDKTTGSGKLDRRSLRMTLPDLVEETR